ncbi:hypothetical protein HANVADRAFT_13754, partial [Hanseniaspora valbyensis NRRL Y-1626]
ATPTQTPIIFAPATYQYDKSQLSEDKLPPSGDPIELFEAWFKEAKEDPSELIPECCSVATADITTGRVSNRVLLLKEVDARGFIIYSNWKTSKKAHDVETNPYVAYILNLEIFKRMLKV